jgi:hypothetical protein
MSLYMGLPERFRHCTAGIRIENRLERLDRTL